MTDRTRHGFPDIYGAFPFSDNDIAVANRMGVILAICLDCHPWKTLPYIHADERQHWMQRHMRDIGHHDIYTWDPE